ncbi:MAG: flagellin lysine-N-methylase [Clostridia bacterium]|nr:flagellin lysine-N-methylase [Clostridia bacterium]
MKLYAPKYYKKFKCIADKCEHSCCIGWEIDIDSESLEKYKSLKNSYGADIINSISAEGTPHFRLCHGDRCPHLDEKGLCKIILNVGEDYLCHICREHPRFYNFTKVAEVGLGMSCREAARIILSSPDYDVFEVLGDVAAEDEEMHFDGREERQRLYALLRAVNADYPTKLASIYRKYGISAGEDGEWLEKINALEYLDPGHREMFACYSAKKRPLGMDAFLERALAYFIYRHCTEANDEEDFSCRLGFCLFCERLLASLAATENAKTVTELAVLASIISEEIEYCEDNTEALK